jgi:acyl-CoA reductase-like NAD-dependent aldehyde dehydrogenase
VLEDAPARNDPIHGAITKRYLQQRSVIFRSSGEILAAIGGSTTRASEQANALCNGIKQGLAAAVSSNFTQLIEDFLQRAKAGILKVNCSTAGAAVDLPFGRWKVSGTGPPEHGPANREFLMRIQSIYFA